MEASSVGVDVGRFFGVRGRFFPLEGGGGVWRGWMLAFGFTLFGPPVFLGFRRCFQVVCIGFGRLGTGVTKRG